MAESGRQRAFHCQTVPSVTERNSWVMTTLGLGPTWYQQNQQSTNALRLSRDVLWVYTLLTSTQIFLRVFTLRSLLSLSVVCPYGQSPPTVDSSHKSIFSKLLKRVVSQISFKVGIKAEKARYQVLEVNKLHNSRYNNNSSSSDTITIHRSWKY